MIDGTASLMQLIWSLRHQGGWVDERQNNAIDGVAPFYDAASKLPADIQTKLDAALAGMKDGSVVTCPPAPECGKTPAPPIGN